MSWVIEKMLFHSKKRGDGKNHKFDFAQVVNDKPQYESSQNKLSRMSTYSMACERNVLQHKSKFFIGKLVTLVGLVIYAKKLENKKSVLLQERVSKRRETIADTILITLNNYELNLLRRKGDARSSITPQSKWRII